MVKLGIRVNTKQNGLFQSLLGVCSMYLWLSVATRYSTVSSLAIHLGTERDMLAGDLPSINGDCFFL